ncbi:MAG: TetR/AcrR family transcriptional regulator [Gammaproteobacteria bacterium]|nr:TetR/AcrR family transcriptional regulator [Gammaproteobacteria bacterium]MBL6999781.1 TetR/AcrR family transcriptional regulator [Gammaproteobacteria bacterium]
MNFSASKRQQIIDAALLEFQNRGFKSSSMDSISKQAEVSKRTVYNHFNSKDELFISVVLYALEKMHDVISTDFDPDSCIEQQLTRIALAEIDLLQSEQLLPFARMLMAELISNPKMALLLESKRPSFETKFDQWLKAAVKHGALSVADFEIAIQQFFGILKGSAFWPALLERKKLSKKQAEKVAQSTVSMFLNSYASRP